jgi:tetratricopeptide (TPR) repeat protein
VRLGRRGDRLNLALFLATRNRDAAEALAAITAEAESRAGVYVDDARAFALYRAGRIDEALAASERALALGTPDARLLFHAGAIRIAAGDAAGGRKLVAQALELNPGFDVTGAREARTLLAGSGAAVAAR